MVERQRQTGSPVVRQGLCIFSQRKSRQYGEGGISPSSALLCKKMLPHMVLRNLRNVLDNVLGIDNRSRFLPQGDERRLSDCIHRRFGL